MICGMSKFSPANSYLYFKERNCANISPFRLHRFAKDSPGANPSDFRTLKHFTKFVGLSILGRLEEMATVDTIRYCIRRFAPG